MNHELEKTDIKSPEEKASEELLKVGLLSIPENIQAVIDQQKAMQHPEGFRSLTHGTGSLEEFGTAMKEKGIKQVIHAEGPNLWNHVMLGIKLVDFVNIPEEKKTDVKLIMLYHDLGKTTSGMADRQINRQILSKELGKGKLYQPTAGHAAERSQDIENGFKANGISGRKLEVFMTVVKSHMETSLSEMSGPKLVKLFESFGGDDDERKKVAELLALVVQIDSNSGLRFELDANNDAALFLKDNRTSVDFDKIWERYLEAKK